MKRIFLFLVLAILSISTVLSQGIGSTAKDFNLSKLQGGTGSLSDYEGKVILAFLFGYNCSSCRNQAAPAFKNQILTEFGNNSDFVAIGLDVWNGSSSQVQGFKNFTGLNIPIFLKGGNTAADWGTTYDRYVVIGADGKFVYKTPSLAAGYISQTRNAVVNALADLATPLGKVENKILQRNYPNPFTISTTIPFTLDKGENVKIEVLDLSGKQINILLSEYYPSGSHYVTFNREGLKSGLYLYKIHTGSKNETKILSIQ